MPKLRFVTLKDLFEVKCKKCGSNDVSLWAQDCPECGTCITAVCHKCDQKFDYHDFKKVRK